jgi:hypothetical protein
MTLQRARNVRIDPTDNADRIDPTDNAEPTENAEPADPTDPIERTEPTEPTDSTEPCDPIDNSESCDQRDNLELDASTAQILFVPVAPGAISSPVARSGAASARATLGARET